MPSGIVLPIQFPNCGRERSAASGMGNIPAAPSWSMAVAAAVAVSVGAVGLNLLILWVQSGRVIDQLPF